MSAFSPPGSNFPAFLTILPKPSHNLLLISSRSKPSEKPFANDFPMLAPSSDASDMSKPNNAIIPVCMPEPSRLPKSPIALAILALPVPFHHFVNGSVINSSHAMETLPGKSATCHSSVNEISLNLFLSWLILLSALSIRLSIAFSTSGIAAASPSAMLRT